MESLQRMPSKIANAYVKLQVLLQEIEAQIVLFTGLPSDTPDLHILAQDIVQKFVTSRNFLTAETVSHNSLPDDLLEFERKLRDLEAEFYRSNVDSVFTIGDHEDDDVSENRSVCESCLNYDPQFDGDDVSSVHEVPELLDEDEVMVPQSPDEFCGQEMISPEKVEEAVFSDCKKEKTGKRRRRWWWRTVVILMLASVVWTVCYFDKQQHEGFLVPT